jgi:hypothetical protein
MGDAAARALQAANDALAHDMNGDFYIVGQQGEIEEELGYRAVYVHQGVAAALALNTAVSVQDRGGVTPAQVRALLELNFWALRSLTGDDAVPETDCMRIAYLRVHGLLKGWGDVGNNPGRYNVRYNDVKVVPDTETFDVGGAQMGIGQAIPNWADRAEVAWRSGIKKKIVNMVCLVAFFMRTRGHHYTDENDGRYKQIWRNCLYVEDEPGLSWNYIAHHAYHFIYPIVLDAIWADAVAGRKCAGALVVRFESAAAGVAAVTAVQVGATDLGIVFPTVRDLIPESFVELDRCVDAISRHRWTGSINRRYYGGPELVVKEKELGALAAIILGALQAVAGTAALRNSPALRRVAQNAPITGTLVVTMITKAAQDERMVEPLFLSSGDGEKE